MTKDFRNLGGGFLLVVISAFVGLLIVERLIIPLTLTKGVDRDIALMGYYAWPNTLVDDTKVNAQGFTGHELPKKEGSFSNTRILTLGGSTMFNRRMTERMIDAWDQVFPTAPQVVGAALRTHSTRASVTKYKYHFSKYRFEYVLIYHGINDLWANNIEPAEFASDYSHLDPWGRRNFLLDNLMIARLVHNYLHPGMGHLTFPDAATNKANFMADRTFENNLRTLVNSVRLENGKPVLMTFAWHIPKNYTQDLFLAGKLEYDNPNRYDYCPVELWGDVSYVEAGLTRYNSIIRNLAAELDVDLIDQFASLSSNPGNFGDPVHFSEAGTDRFIANITDYFKHEAGIKSQVPGSTHANRLE